MLSCRPCRVAESEGWVSSEAMIGCAVAGLGVPPACPPQLHPTPSARLYIAAGTANMSDSTSQPPDTKMEVIEDLDPSVENEINHDATQADAMNPDGANDEAPAVNGAAEATAAFEQRIPAKKDATLREFLGKMDEFAPIVSVPRIAC